LNYLFKIFLIFIFVAPNCYSLGNSYYQKKYDATKKLYLGAIISNKKNHKQKEIEYLKKLILYGDKLRINTIKYKRELNRLDDKTVLKNKVNVKSILKPKYSIKSVKQYKHTITIEFNHKIDTKYIDFVEKKEKGFYFDNFYIKGNYKYANPTKLKMKGVYKIQIYQKKKNLLVISFKNKKNLKTIYIINKNQIIIKVLAGFTKQHSKTYKKRAKPKKSKPKTIKQKVKVIQNNDIFYPFKKTIVIDAGHGGKDSGATNKKRYEKNIVLKIAKYLKQDLQKMGFKVYLTRSKDIYVKLSHRTRFANKRKADMFISIHANAARKARAKKAHGVETYFLSPARSERAKRVAALENKGDMSKMGWSSKNSLLTILNRAKITAANKMAIDVQKNMLYKLRKTYGKKAIRDGGVREGPFWVLVGAQMPSILVEVGYISHPKEGYRISTRRYQKLISKGISEGVKSYFIKN